MIDFRCVNVQCGELLRVDERYGGRLVRCFRCGQPSPCPTASLQSSHRTAGVRVLFWAMLGFGLLTPFVALLLLGLLAGKPTTPNTRLPRQVAQGQVQTPPVSTQRVAVKPSPIGSEIESIPWSPAANPAKARGLEMLRQNAGALGDPELGTAYQAINERHFAGALPKIPVIWEPGLREIGPLTAENFTLEGLWGLVGKETLILLNPDLRLDRRKLERALCHEMVHEYLFTVGDTQAHHGPAFQQQLHRLSEERAFEGILASETEKVSLRAWLEGESARLDSVKAELDKIGRDIDREGGDLAREVAELNARTSRANAQGSGWPSDDEIRSVKSRQELLRQRVADFNWRVGKRNADGTQFNREANRYNLMMSYPDGLDEESVIRPKSATGPAKRP